jgi:adenylate cyclase
MAETHVTRKLAAIFYADAARYSGLTGADEEGTHHILSAYLDAITNMIEEHDGRVLHYAGDAILAEFASVVVAVNCAVEVQRDLTDRNNDLSDDRKVQFRLGVNLGDVIVDRGEIYGDGVNVAARLNGLADPGGICISRKVLDEVRGKLEVGFEFLGDQKVKNIERPIATYKVLMDPKAAGGVVGEDRAWSRLQAPVGAAVLAVVVGLGVLWFVLRPAPPSETMPENVTGQTLASPVRTGKPSIVILPFANMSGDVQQDYFSDGFTEDLLTDLSKISALKVISRTSSVAYKGKRPDIRTVAKELGASHVIEGSVRRAGRQVRITVQLIDAATGTHLWAERYDRELKNIFALQDDVRNKVVTALAVKLAAVELKRLARKGTDSVEAYDLFMQGRHQESSFTREGNAAAIGFYKKAIGIDPNFANAYARLANMYDFSARFGWSKDAERDRAKAVKFARKAIALDDMNPFSHWTLGRILSRLRSGGMINQFNAVSALERAIALDPNYADAYGFISVLYVGIGKPDEAVAAIELATKLNPQHPFWYIQNRGVIRYLRGDYNAAIADFEKAAERNPTAIFIRYWLAAAYSQAGQQNDADWQMEEMKVLGLQSTVKEIVERSLLHHPPYVERFAAGLRKAGIPD